MNPEIVPPEKKEIWTAVWDEIKDIFFQLIHLRDTTDIKGTIDGIRKGIEIRGYNVWILACGAMLASIGLDQNSAAVIIGAMGAGGIGLQFLGAMRTGTDWENVAYISIIVLATVMLMDMLSAKLRRRLIS